MTFNEIRQKAIRTAINLRNFGYKLGNVFGLMVRNSKDVSTIIFASFFNGYSVNSLDPFYKKLELNHMLKITKPCVLFCDVDKYDLVEDSLKELELNADIFTIGGKKGRSKPIEILFIESDFNSQFA